MKTPNPFVINLNNDTFTCNICNKVHDLPEHFSRYYKKASDKYSITRPLYLEHKDCIIKHKERNADDKK